MKDILSLVKEFHFYTRTEGHLNAPGLKILNCLLRIILSVYILLIFEVITKEIEILNNTNLLINIRQKKLARCKNIYLCNFRFKSAKISSYMCKSSFDIRFSSNFNVC